MRVFITLISVPIYKLRIYIEDVLINYICILSQKVDTNIIKNIYNTSGCLAINDTCLDKTVFGKLNGTKPKGRLGEKSGTTFVIYSYGVRYT